ncbi:MAG: hypothetical protein LBU34_10045 [Planctomycetaceae bacterium]|jgi:hypothetical protein|nr:hypothetical protein [Planctomycetaceae bacterium]
MKTIYLTLTLLACFIAPPVLSEGEPFKSRISTVFEKIMQSIRYRLPAGKSI